MFRYSIRATVLACLIAVFCSPLLFAAPRVIYEEDFSDQPVGSSITSPPASWTRGTSDKHNGELVVTDATKLGPRAVDGSASTEWYSWAYKAIPNLVRPTVYTFTCRAWAPAGAHGCGLGFGKDDGKGGINCAVAWWYVRLDNERGAWLFDARALAAELAQDRKAYLPNFPGFVAPGGAEPVLVGGADQEVQLTITVDSERHQVWGAVTEAGGTVHKSRIFTTDPGWTNAGIPRNEERVNSVVIWQHNVLSWLPQIDVADIHVVSDEVPPQLTPEELALDRPFTIIHNGWTTPDTKYLRDNVADLEKRSFDGYNLRVADPRDERGVVFNGVIVNGKRQMVDIGWRAFQKNVRFTPDQVEPAIQDLKAARSSMLKHNCIGITSLLPANVNMDWFDDAWWDNINNNVRLLARLAKQGGCEGFLLDPEEYLRGYLWTFEGLAKDPMYAGKTYGGVAAVARRRGRHLIEAVNSEYPGIHIIIIHCWETVLSSGGKDRERLAEVHLSLLPPFL